MLVYFNFLLNITIVATIYMTFTKVQNFNSQLNIKKKYFSLLIYWKRYVVCWVCMTNLIKNFSIFEINFISFKLDILSISPHTFCVIFKFLINYQILRICPSTIYYLIDRVMVNLRWAQISSWNYIFLKLYTFDVLFDHNLG